MFNLNFSDIPLIWKFDLQFMPQKYYLRINRNNGFNYTSTLTLTRKNFPVSISAFGNKTIQCRIPESKDLICNISLIYNFSTDYSRVR
jgi:hypothetical protein